MRVAMATSPSRTGVPNEDFVGATADGVVLLDGAGLYGTTSQCRHGVAWYARRLGGALLTGLVDQDRDLATILDNAIAETARAHADTCDVTDPGTPSATVVMLRLGSGYLQYLVLADSVLVLDDGGDTPTVITDDRVGRAALAYRTAMEAEATGTPEHDRALRDYVEALRSQRNRPGGFWVAAADPSVVTEAITGQHQVDGLHSATLLSDGASRICDLYGLASWREILDLLDNHDPAELLRSLREVEASDPSGARWPRHKTHDDATMAHCSGLHEPADVRLFTVPARGPAR